MSGDDPCIRLITYKNEGTKFYMTMEPQSLKALEKFKSIGEIPITRTPVFFSKEEVEAPKAMCDQCGFIFEEATGVAGGAPSESSSQEPSSEANKEN